MHGIPPYARPPLKKGEPDPKPWEKPDQHFLLEDDTWQIYKSMIMAEAGLDLKKKKEIYTSQQSVKGNTKQMTNEQLMALATKSVEDKEQIESWNKHTAIMNKLTETITVKKLADVVETEQLILSGTDTKL